MWLSGAPGTCKNNSQPGARANLSHFLTHRTLLAGRVKTQSGHKIVGQKGRQCAHWSVGGSFSRRDKATRVVGSASQRRQLTLRAADVS